MFSLAATSNKAGMAKYCIPDGPRLEDIDRTPMRNINKLRSKDPTNTKIGRVVQVQVLLVGVEKLNVPGEGHRAFGSSLRK